MGVGNREGVVVKTTRKAAGAWATQCRVEGRRWIRKNSVGEGNFVRTRKIGQKKDEEVWDSVWDQGLE